MPPEEWRAIPGYEGLYEVSDQGRVRSLDRICRGPVGTTERHNGRVLKGYRLSRGHYHAVDLSKDSQKTHRTVHSLVAEAFVGPRPPGMDVMHLDGDRGNNRVENLRYGTRTENLHQTYEYGGRQANGKLTKTEAMDVIRRLEKGEHPIALAEEYGVNNAAIYHIRNGTAFKWLREEMKANAP